MFIDTAGCDMSDSGEDGESKSNEGEARIVLEYVSLLRKAGLHASAIAVITPYRYLI